MSLTRPAPAPTHPEVPTSPPSGSAGAAGPELDLARVRAFVQVAEQLNFSLAARQLFLTQQAVSLRIRRLEQSLGTRLLARNRQSVALTEAGRRFLPRARDLLAAEAAATAALRAETQPLRVDVWGTDAAPLRMLTQLSRSGTVPDLDVTARRSLRGAVDALQRGEIDLALVPVPDHQPPWADDLARHPALLDPLNAVVRADHPAADTGTLHPADLGKWTVWWPLGNGSKDLHSYVRRFADHFRLDVDTDRRGIGAVSPVEAIGRHPDDILVWGSDWPAPVEPRVRTIRLAPRPVIPWSAIWRHSDRSAALGLLVDQLTSSPHRQRWLRYDPDHHWAPGISTSRLSA